MKNLNYSANKDNHKIGRNDPCFCGSGKKYKKCCLTENLNGKIQSDELKTQQESLQTLKDRVQERYKDQKHTIVSSEEMGLVKMSDIILEFAKEIVEVADSPIAQDKYDNACHNGMEPCNC